MLQVMVRNNSISPSRLRLLWHDSRCLNVYVVGTATIAVWLKFAMMVVHWRTPGVWLH
jgi:hypothetical protein